jgi:hypothetical protein
MRQKDAGAWSRIYPEKFNQEDQDDLRSPGGILIAVSNDRNPLFLCSETSAFVHFVSSIARHEYR